MRLQLTRSRRFWLTRVGLLGGLLAGVGLFAGLLLAQESSPPEARSERSGDKIGNVARPVIGIASLSDATYVRAVRDAGGIPIVLPNTDGNADRINDYIEMIDGLLMPGGADIPPHEYGEEPHETVYPLSDERYEFERDLCRKWIEETDKPLLGICLGSQWINVASGGSLVQDIPTRYGVNHRGVNHPVAITAESKLHHIFGRDSFEVNSSHHQSVGRLGRNLRIVASSPDGVVEATETTDPNRFLIGVQWHPERLVVTDKQQAKLFRAFIEAAREHRASQESRRPLTTVAQP